MLHKLKVESMKLIIFGATGSVGRHLVEQSLAAGHRVTAFTREAKKVTLRDTRLTVCEGDVLNSRDVAGAIEGHDMVLCALGGGRKGDVRSKGTRNIIEGMKANGVRRLICQTTLGCGESWGNLSFFWRRVMFGWFLKEVFTDHELQERHILASDLEWTIVRPAAFTEGKLTKQFNFNFAPEEKSLQLKISRADLAYFMLRQTHDDAFVNSKVGLSY